MSDRPNIYASDAARSVSEKEYKSFRCKSSTGYSCRWSVGKTSRGDYKALSVGEAKVRGQPIPSDFLPFEIMDAVMNPHIRFGSLIDAEMYVRSL